MKRWITISLLRVSLWEGCTHLPGANTPPISCKLFHMNPLIPLQCLEGFCSITHTHTPPMQAQAPRLHLAAIQGWKMLPKRVAGSGTRQCLGTGGSHGNYLAAATRGRQEMMKSHLKLDFRNNLLPFFISLSAPCQSKQCVPGTQGQHNSAPRDPISMAVVSFLRPHFAPIALSHHAHRAQPARGEKPAFISQPVWVLAVLGAPKKW